VVVLPACDILKGNTMIYAERLHFPVKARETAWGRFLPGQSLTGYGSKITTDYKVEYEGRLYRVYATCFSNAASHWILVKGEKIFVS
jgi:hypothetical protein